MSEPQELPEGFRARLAAAADAEAAQHPLSPQAEQRLVAALVQAQGQAGRPGRHVWIAAVLAAAAALAIAFWPARPPETASLPTACGLPSGPVLSARAGASRLDLGALGDILAAPGARLAVKASARCELVVEVSAGHVLVDVHKLAPARLVLATPHGDVIVRGTQFALDVGEQLDVHLVSGRVEVVDPGDTSGAALLEAGNSLSHRRAGGTRTHVLTDAERAEVRSLHALRTRFVAEAPAPGVAQASAPEQASVAQVDPAPPAMLGVQRDFLARAEDARRRGAPQVARRFYAQATRTNPADAEVALLRWARFELDQRRPAAASGLLARHRRAFAHGALAAEAAWLAVEVAQARGDRAGARAGAAALLREHPATPQAEAARRLIAEP